MRGERLPQRFSLGSEAEEAGVEAAAIFRDGVAVLTPGGHLWCGGRDGGKQQGSAVARARELAVLRAHAARSTSWRSNQAIGALPAGLPPTPCANHHCHPHTPLHCRCVPDITEPRPQRFPDPAPGLAVGGVAGSGVHCMAVLPPSVSSSGALEVSSPVLI